MIAEAIPSNEDNHEICLDLESRFGSDVPAEVDEADLLKDIICMRIEGGHVCGFHIEAKSTPCLKMTSELGREGVFMTQALFEQIAKRIGDQPN